MTDWMAAIGEGLDKEQEQIAAEEAVRFEDQFSTESSFDVADISELCRLSINWLAGVAVPHVFKFNYPPILIAAWALLINAVGKTRDFTKIVLGIPRGHGKTMLIKLLILYCILFTKKKYIMIICVNEGKAINIITDVCNMLQQSNIKRVFGDWRLGQTKDTEALKIFGFRGRTIIIEGIGKQGAVRGSNIDYDRPDLMIFDDIQSADEAKSDVVSDAIYTWMLGTAMKACSPFGCTFIYAGNMYPGPNSILKKLKNNKTWVKFISGAILADGTALWPELRPLEGLLEELDNDIEAGKPEIFFAEVLNDTEAGINTRTDLSLIQQWPWGPNELPQGKFIIIDPSGDKAGSDDCVIGYAEVFDGKPGLKSLISEVLSPGATILKALLLAMQTGTRLIAVESVAYQASLLYWFNQIAEKYELTGFIFVEVHTGVKSKNTRISSMLKSLTANEIAIHQDVRSQVTHQIAHWNPLKKQNTDGILDILCYLPKVIELYQHAILTENDIETIEASGAYVSSAETTNPF